MLTSWTDCRVSKGRFGDVPAPDLSRTFFFLTCTALGGKPGLSTLGWCQQQQEQSASSSRSRAPARQPRGEGCAAPPCVCRAAGGHSWLHSPQPERESASLATEAVQTYSHNTSWPCLPTWAQHTWCSGSELVPLCCVTAGEEAARVNCREFPKSERISASEELLVLLWDWENKYKITRFPNAHIYPLYPWLSEAPQLSADLPSVTTCVAGGCSCLGDSGVCAQRKSTLAKIILSLISLSVGSLMAQMLAPSPASSHIKGENTLHLCAGSPNSNQALGPPLLCSVR